MSEDKPDISVVLPTFQRAGLLRDCLASLQRQTLPAQRFEVVVVDDGSSDETAEVCANFARAIRLRYFRLRHAGNPAMKNLGILASSAPVTLFFDDDDVASDGLLDEHLAMHEAFPNPSIAVLGYTTWASSLELSELMYYLTEVGQNLFSYRQLSDGAMLDFRHFWAGRISCKRTLLVSHGLFNQAFPSIIEDIELGYRLSRQGLRVVYNEQAVSYMNRAVSSDDFYRRSERQGAALYLFARLHADTVVHAYCDTAGACSRWRECAPRVAGWVERIRALEAAAGDAEVDFTPYEREELWRLYRETFGAFRLKGMVHAAANAGLA